MIEAFVCDKGNVPQNGATHATAFIFYYIINNFHLKLLILAPVLAPNGHNFYFILLLNNILMTETESAPINKIPSYFCHI